MYISHLAYSGNNYVHLPSCCRQYPVGVLYDLYGRGGQLPWTVTVHFKVSEQYCVLGYLVLSEMRYESFHPHCVHKCCGFQFTLNTVQLPSHCCSSLIKLAFLSSVNTIGSCCSKGTAIHSVVSFPDSNSQLLSHGVYTNSFGEWEAGNRAIHDTHRIANASWVLYIHTRM